MEIVQNASPMYRKDPVNSENSFKEDLQDELRRLAKLQNLPFEYFKDFTPKEL
jgi:hypothetical protein